MIKYIVNSQSLSTDTIFSHKVYNEIENWYKTTYLNQEIVMQNFKYLYKFSDIGIGINLISKKELEEFEKKHNLKLPDDYVEFLTFIGQGHLEHEYQNIFVKLKNKIIMCSLDYFESFRLEPKIKKIEVFGEKKNALFIAIGNYGGDFEENCYMSLDEKDYGNIYFFKLFDNLQLIRWVKCVKIADSFTDLMEQLTEADFDKDRTDDFEESDFENDLNDDEYPEE